MLIFSKNHYILLLVLSVLVISFATYSLIIKYLIWDFKTILGLLLLPYLLPLQVNSDPSTRYLWVAIPAVFLAIFTSQYTFYFFGFGMVLYFWIDYFIGKLPNWAIFVWFVLSPLLTYFSIVFGFPIRLYLTEIVGNSLQSIGFDVVVIGNIIRLNGVDFSVDPACAGLKLTETAYLLCLLVLAYFAQTTKKTIHWLWVTMLMGFVLALTILCNLLRIMLLVVFKISPENPLHDMAGLLSLVTYVLIPFYWLTKITFYYLGNNKKVDFIKFINIINYNFIYKKSFKSFLLPTILLIILGVQGWRLANYETLNNNPPTPSLQLAGYTKKILPDHIIQFTNKESLIYLKPLTHFYKIEHSPLICWQGSGYKFNHSKKIIVDNQELFCGTLQKQQDTLYTAWWFSNGKYQTIQPLAWRWQQLQDKKECYLVNISSNHPDSLLRIVKKLLRKI